MSSIYYLAVFFFNTDNYMMVINYTIHAELINSVIVYLVAFDVNNNYCDFDLFEYLYQVLDLCGVVWYMILQDFQGAENT